MNAYETSATVLDQGRVEVAGVPFAAGTQVDVIINAKRRSAEEFIAAWRQLTTDLRSGSGMAEISDEEIDRYRAGQ
jgi:hypothetical protein